MDGTLFCSYSDKMKANAQALDLTAVQRLAEAPYANVCSEQVTGGTVLHECLTSTSQGNLQRTDGS